MSTGVLSGKPERGVTEQIKDKNGNVTSIIQYDFLSKLPQYDGLWIENCINCHVPMRKVRLDSKTIVLGIPESARHRGNKFSDWATNPVVGNGSTFWGCSSCNSIWTIVLGESWVKVSLDGITEIKMEHVKSANPEIKEEVKVEHNPGVETEGSTKCPQCHAWRTVKPYSETEDIHMCPNCKTGQITPKKITEVEEENVIALEKDKGE